MAGRLSDAWLDDLRSRLDIVEVVSDYVQLAPKGRRYWGLCPFHNEKSASFSVDPEAQMYYCFGCHEGGTVIHFVMELERMEFMEAVTLLADRAHISMPESQGSAPDAPTKALKERLHEANQQAARYFHEQIWTAEGAFALTYLHKRGLDDADIRRFGLGASGSGWTDMTEELMKRGFTEDELIKAGLTGRKEHRAYDMFRGRVMFPIINAQGHVLGFGGRAMGDATPKYLNTPDTPVFNKRQGLYAMNMVRKEGHLKRLILVEGYMDVVSLRRAGVSGVVATLGTALTEEQARLIKRYAPEVWVSYDGDAAGQKAILRALDIFDAQQMKARVLNFPDAMDPDDFIRMHGLQGFEKLKPMGPVEYRMLRARDDFDMSDQQGRTEYAIHCCQMLKSVRNPVELHSHIDRLMVDTGFEREVLLEQIGVTQQRGEQKRRAPRRASQGEDGPQDYERAERSLLLLLSSRLIPPEAVSPDDFETALYAQIASLLKSGATPSSILDQLPEDQRKQAASALNAEVLPDEKNALTVADDCLKAIRIHRIEAATQELGALLKAASGDERKQLMEQTMQLTQELDRLKTGRKGWSV